MVLTDASSNMKEDMSESFFFHLGCSILFLMCLLNCSWARQKRRVHIIVENIYMYIYIYFIDLEWYKDDGNEELIRAEYWTEKGIPRKIFVLF